MSDERIFSIFMYFENGAAVEYGVRHHRVGGCDEDKMRVLKERVDADHGLARRFALIRSFSKEQWFAAMRLGGVLDYFSEGLDHYRAGENPLHAVTCIVDGKPEIDIVIDTEAYRGDQVSRRPGHAAVPDYLVEYVRGDQFLFMELINDDYFKAIRMLFNAGLYVSSAKLLMSCVDTLAFVEYGDVSGNFASWVDNFMDLRAHAITSEELWEFRNSVLHMTNLASRKVMAGKVSPLIPYVGGMSTLPPLTESGSKPFNLLGLIKTVGAGVGRWADSYNADPDKYLAFIERYDRTISDSRYAAFSNPVSGAENAVPDPR